MKSKQPLTRVIESIKGIKSFFYHRYVFKIRRVIPYLLLGIVAFIVLKFIYQNIFYVKTININTIPVNATIEQDIKDQMEQVLGKNIILLNTGEIIRALKAEFSQVQQLNIIKELPNTLVINAKVILPKYYLFCNQKYYSIDETNKIFDITNSNEYPNIPQVQSLQSGTLEMGIAIEEFSYNQILSLTSVDWNSFEVELRNISHSSFFDLSVNDRKFNCLFHIYLSSKYDQSKILEIMTLLQKDEFRAKKYSEIDLRFGKAVIRYQ